MKVFISTNPKNLAAKLAEFKYSATVEAEYGDDVVEGSVLTLAHHGPRKDNPNPCLHENMPNTWEGGTWEFHTPEAIGISHFDLDCIGGVAAIMGRKPGLQDFWELAAHIDSNGPHRAADSPDWDEHKSQYYAYCAWAQQNKYWAPKDGTVEDVTRRIETTIEFLTNLIQKNGIAWIEAGATFEKKLAEDETRCLIQSGRIRIFAGDVFCSAFYRNADSTIADATICYGTKSGAITLAFEDGGKRYNAANILQEVFGSEAGGHAGIAGSPRGKRMDFGDLAATVFKVRSILQDEHNSISFVYRQIHKRDLP